MDKLNIAVLCGGSSGERNISLKSGKAVFLALKEKGHNVIAIDPALGENCKFDLENLDIPTESPSTEELENFPVSNFIKAISSENFQNIDICFNLVHGNWGEDGHLTSLLDLKDIKYTGSGLRGSAVAMDKNMSKRLFEAAGIMTPEWIMVSQESADDDDLIKQIRREFGRELVIKPSDQGSALGMTIIKDGNLDDIQNAIKEAGRFTNRILIERYIAGRELTVAVVGDDIYPIVEIKPLDGFYDYQNKYTKGRTEYVCPADLPDDVNEFVQNTAETAHRVLGITGYSRIDFRLNEDFIPYCLEANTVPGFTELSLLPMSAKEGGLEFGDLCEEIIRLGLEGN